MLEHSALTDPGKVRAANQDYFRIVPELGLYLIADGMGGARGGERASQMAVEAVVENLTGSRHRDAAALLEAMKEANRQVLAAATGDPLLEGMGTTLVAALETEENDIAIASVGDSRAWLAEEGSLRAITEDQTWIQEVGRTLGIDDHGLKTHPMRHVLTMAVGVGPELRVRYYAVTLKPGAIIMLSSDGLHGVVPEEEMKEILLSGDDKNGSSLQDKCHRLVAAAHGAGSPDNITVLLIQRPPDGRYYR